MKKEQQKQAKRNEIKQNSKKNIANQVRFAWAVYMSDAQCFAC